MIRFVLVGFVLVVLLGMNVLAQDSSKTEVESQLEKAFEELDDEEGITGEQLVQFLEDLAANPVNINSAEVTDLLQIPGLTIVTANAIINYRKQKPFERIDELIEVPGIGEATLRRIRPYVTIGSAAERFKTQYTRHQYWLHNSKVEMLSRFQQTLEKQEGYLRADTAGGYLGNPVKYYQRFRLQSNHLSLNLTQEKDAGEPLTSPTDFDFNSWHLALYNNGRLQSLVVGDYSLSFAQGLVLWTGGAFGKGRDVISTISKNERGLRPYSSAQETDFFRGVAATYGKDLQLTAFYSSRPRSASVISGDTTRFPSSTGFHRTLTERERRNNITQQTMGGRVSYNSRFGLLGITGLTTNFSSYIDSGSGLYDFRGTQNSVFGADYRGLIGNSLVFGEVARSQSGGVGAIVGLETSVTHNTNLAILARHYQADFHSFTGAGFGERSGNPRNEQGLYLGLRHQINSVFEVSTYFDQYQFLGDESSVSKKTTGYDVLGLVEARFTKALNAYLLVRAESKDKEYTQIDETGRELIALGKHTRNSVRLQAEYQVNSYTRLRTRGEYVRYYPVDESWENGMLVYQDVRLQLSKTLKLDTRLTLFDTDSFDSRVYQFENDLLYVLSNVALSEQGQRWYAVLDFKPTKYLQIWLKYSQTMIEDAAVLSSGLNQIQGNKRSFLGIQCRFLWN